MKNVILKPAKQGIKLFDPASGNMIPDTGKRVPLNQYWSRRIKEGGAVILDAKAPIPVAKHVKKSEKFKPENGGPK